MGNSRASGGRAGAGGHKISGRNECVRLVRGRFARASAAWWVALPPARISHAGQAGVRAGGENTGGTDGSVHAARRDPVLPLRTVGALGRSRQSPRFCGMEALRRNGRDRIFPPAGIADGSESGLKGYPLGVRRGLRA
jgi:hypothetical protein